MNAASVTHEKITLAELTQIFYALFLHSGVNINLS